MIDNILDKSKNSIIMDRLIDKNPNGEINIITDSMDIKEKVHEHFRQWTRKRITNLQLMNKWKKWYEPIPTINFRWYNSLLEEVNTSELEEVIRLLPNKKAPGQSGIQYEWFKHLPENGTEVFRNIINMAIELNDIPTEWKYGYIYPIPKTTEWGHDLKITRPITLLETGRKIFMKIINNRLSVIFSNHKILTPHNYAGLPGDDTQSPIHVINNIMEDARAKGNELWLMFQDMSKAFDSVNSDSLSEALRRIKIPTAFITLIKNLLQNRENMVITTHGNTTAYKVEDGIDQGDILSPILWRIFYDPLMNRIANSNLGYKMTQEWISDLKTGKEDRLQTKIAVAAYVDDTNWFAPSKDKMEKMLDIANEFFVMNDIAINKNKSYLIVINSSNEEREMGVRMGADILYPVDRDFPVRSLGVHVTETGSKRFQKERMKKVSDYMAYIMRGKQITDKQAIYIFNAVVMPMLEYNLNDMVLNENECKKITTSFLTIIKYKASLSATIPNAVLYAKEGYNVFNLWERQLQLHTNNLLNRFNNKN
jgi:hypothetical protein